MGVNGGVQLVGGFLHRLKEIDASWGSWKKERVVREGGVGASGGSV